MSEQIDVRADIDFAGAAGDAFRGELAALTRRVAAAQAGPGPAGAAVHRASGCAEELAATSGDPPEPPCRLHPDPAGSAAMTAADRTRGYYARCVPLLARLRLPASQDAGAPLPPGEAGHAARAIVAETGAAGQAAVAAVAEGGRRSAAVFLAARQARLAAAADSIVAAAEDGSAEALSRPVRRFEALSSALWTVQPAPAVPAARGPSGP